MFRITAERGFPAKVRPVSAPKYHDKSTTGAVHGSTTRRNFRVVASPKRSRRNRAILVTAAATPALGAAILGLFVLADLTARYVPPVLAVLAVVVVAALVVTRELPGGA